VRGVIAWRGIAIPLLEPDDDFETDWQAAVVVTGDAGEMALAADQVEGWVNPLDAAEIVDVESLQKRVRDRIRRGTDFDRNKASENNNDRRSTLPAPRTR
jgi:hypothetical protein